MSTAVMEQPTNQLAVMTADSVTPQAFQCEVDALKAKATGYQSLKVNGLADKAGLKAVREARLDLARVRCDIEKRRTEMKAGALAFGKAVDSTAKSLTALVEPTEKALKAIEDDIAKEAQREKDKRTAERMEKLKAVESKYPEVVVADFSDKEFDKLLAEMTVDYAERQKVAAEQAEQARIKAEEDAKERARLKAEDDERRRVAEAELAAEREKLRIQREQQESEEAERKRIADAELAVEREKLRKQREEQEARDREQAAERKRLDDIRAKQEAEEQARKKAEDDERARAAEGERKIREEAERKRLAELEDAKREAMKPDFEKLMDVAKSLAEITLPEVSAAANVAKHKIMLVIEEARGSVERIAHEECGVSFE